MAFNGFQCDALRVLADDAQNDTATRKRLYGMLEIDECLTDSVVTTELQILPAHIADDAAPHRIVKVKDEQFACLP